MSIRLLELADYEKIEKLIRLNVSRQNDYDYERGLHWIRHAYLNPEVPTQGMFGFFVGEELCFTYSFRLHFPTPETATVGNAFSHPQKVQIAGVRKTIAICLQYLKSHNINCVYSLVKSTQADRQALLLPPDLNHRIETLIPAQTQPTEEFIWSLMGRRLLREDQALRKIEI